MFMVFFLPLPLCCWKEKERREIGPCFPRETAFSQASSLRLLVDCSMMTSFLGSARSSTLRPIQSKLKLAWSLRKISSSKKPLCAFFYPWGSLSTEIPIYRERYRSMNRSRLSSIRIDMSLWATTPIFSYMFWSRPFPLRRGRFGSFNLMSWGMWPMWGP